MDKPEVTNVGWPDEEVALQMWQILHGKCKVPLKHRYPYRRYELKNGIKCISFNSFVGITNHPQVHDPLNSGEEMWILDQIELYVIGRVTSEGNYIRYPQGRYR